MCRRPCLRKLVYTCRGIEDLLWRQRNHGLRSWSFQKRWKKKGKGILLWSNESSFYLQLRWLGRKSWSVKPSDIYAQRHSCLRLELYKSWCFGLYYKCQVIVNCIVTLLFILQIDTRIRDGNGNKNVIPDDPGTFLCFNRLYPWCGCLLLTHSTKGKDQTSLSNQPQS